MENVVAGSYAKVSEMMPDILALFGDFSVDNMLLIVGGLLAITVPLCIAWFGFNYGKRKAAGALKKGRL